MSNLLYKVRSALSKVSPTDRAEYLRKNNIISIGEGCEIYQKVSFGSEPYLVKLGNKVRVTLGTRFITHDGGMWVIRNLGWSSNADKMGNIEVGDNVMIGQNSIIMPGVKIGSNVVIGSGSIVTKNIPDNSVAAGIPARVLSSIEDYYNKNKDKIFETKQMGYEEKKDFYLKKFNLN